jgi:hypothetical protein
LTGHLTVKMTTSLRKINIFSSLCVPETIEWE